MLYIVLEKFDAVSGQSVDFHLRFAFPVRSGLSAGTRARGRRRNSGVSKTNRKAE